MFNIMLLHKYFYWKLIIPNSIMSKIEKSSLDFQMV